MDNANLIAITKDSGDKVYTALVAELKLKGFVLRDEAVASQNFEFLGMVLNGASGRRHTARRCWCLWYAHSERCCKCDFPPALSVLEEIFP